MSTRSSPRAVLRCVRWRETNRGRLGGCPAAGAGRRSRDRANWQPTGLRRPRAGNAIDTAPGGSLRQARAGRRSSAPANSASWSRHRSRRRPNLGRAALLQFRGSWRTSASGYLIVPAKRGRRVLACTDDAERRHEGLAVDGINLADFPQVRSKARQIESAPRVLFTQVQAFRYRSRPET